jgi:hypothetical protein
MFATIEDYEKHAAKSRRPHPGRISSVLMSDPLQAL